MTPTQYVKLMAPYNPYDVDGNNFPQALYNKLDKAWETFTHTQRGFILNALMAKVKLAMSGKKLKAKCKG
jgi:hypothetical protein